MKEKRYPKASFQKHFLPRLKLAYTRHGEEAICCRGVSRPATQRLTGKKEGQVHLDSYNGQGAWRPWSFSLTEDDDEDLLTDEDAMSQDEEEVLSSSWSGSSEGGEFPNLREPKEKRVQSTKASGYQSGSVPRRPQRKRQGGRRGHYGKSIPAQRHKSRHLKCVLYFDYRA